MIIVGVLVAVAVIYAILDERQRRAHARERSRTRSAAAQRQTSDRAPSSGAILWLANDVNNTAKPDVLAREPHGGEISLSYAGPSHRSCATYIERARRMPALLWPRSDAEQGRATRDTRSCSSGAGLRAKGSSRRRRPHSSTRPVPAGHHRCAHDLQSRVLARKNPAAHESEDRSRLMWLRGSVFCGQRSSICCQIDVRRGSPQCLGYGRHSLEWPSRRSDSRDVGARPCPHPWRTARGRLTDPTLRRPLCYPQSHA